MDIIIPPGENRKSSNRINNAIIRNTHFNQGYLLIHSSTNGGMLFGLASSATSSMVGSSGGTDLGGAGKTSPLLILSTILNGFMVASKGSSFINLLPGRITRRMAVEVTTNGTLLCFIV